MNATGSVELLATRLGVDFSFSLLELALTHRSFAYENGGIPTNERLEFLGDSVLGLVVTETLFRRYSDRSEGDLAKMRSAVVNARALADVARSIDLGNHVRLGRGEISTGGSDKSSILADTMEAVLGAVYLGCGADVAASLIHRLFDPVIERSAALGAGLDWKTSLQELASSKGPGVPEYVVTEAGPPHQKTFSAVVRIGRRDFVGGAGRTKKEAEQRAAENAWRALNDESDAGTARG